MIAEPAPHDPGRWSFLVPAAGAGERLGLGPKCLLSIGTEPLWQRAVRRASLLADDVVIAVPGELVADIDRAAAGRCRVIAGGGTRQETVAKLLEAAATDRLLVHDAARPFGSPTLMRAVAAVAERTGAAACLVACQGPVVRIGPDGEAGPSVAGPAGVVVSPLAFRRSVLEDALRHASVAGVVARSTVELVMAAGHAVRLVASEPDNLKLTTPDDLDLARRLVAAWDARHGGGIVSS